MTPPHVTVLIEYRAQPDHAAEAVFELDTLVAKVVASEPDCFGIRLLQDPADPTRVLLYEEWSSREAYLGPHFQTPHLKAFIERGPALFAGPPEIRFWVEQSRHAR
ncbi:MAG: antibiotic biosynthesis monooxygenase [Acidobacteria bacterium]|nr:antibiotic biosynthesis monooxygenase [Acidobacteriota bacterium]